MPDLIFYTNPQSRGRVARWMLEEVGAPYETMILDFEGGMKSPGYLAINPMGKVPTIKHGETVVTETAAICAYMADTFPTAGLAPPHGSRQRGPYYRWLFFAAGPVECAGTGKALNLLAPPDKSRLAGYGSYDDTVNALERAVTENHFLCGDRFSAADLYVASQIGFMTSFGMLPKRDAFLSYVERATDRPAYRRAAELDAEAMPKQDA